MADQSVRCPKCDHSDQIRKLSAIERDDAGTQTSHLVTQLARPRKPQVKASNFTTFLIIGAVILCLGLNSLNARRSVGVGPGGFGVVAVIVGLIIFAVALSSNFAEAKKTRSELPAWKNAMGRWEKLYYCARDDIIFDEDDLKPMSVEEMRPYLYR
jgi:hypothetical protein